MKTLLSLIAIALFATVDAHAGQAPTGPERFELASIKAVRPTLVTTIAALKKADVAAAKEAFEAFDSGWNGVEVYINVRYPEMYKELEGNVEVKGKMRALMRERVKRRMLAAVPTADLVVMNPTHYAVALKYDMLPWTQLIKAWRLIHALLIHTVAVIPESRYGTPCRIGLDPEIPISQLVENYAARIEEVAGEILTRDGE